MLNGLPGFTRRTVLMSLYSVLERTNRVLIPESVTYSEMAMIICKIGVISNENINMERISPKLTIIRI